jgi:hypothetical protein
MALGCCLTILHHVVLFYDYGPVVHGDMLCRVALVSFVRLPVGKNSSAKFLSSLLVCYGSFCLKGSSFRCLGHRPSRVRFYVRDRYFVCKALCFQFLIPLRTAGFSAILSVRGAAASRMFYTKHCTPGRCAASSTLVSSL